MPVSLNLELFAQRLFKPKRFVLLIGDAGAMIAKLSGNHVEWHHYLTGALDNTIAQAKLTLAEFPKLPVTVLFDNLGQSYRRERVPPVNLLDRPKIVARKLDTLFPGTEFKGGLRLGLSEGDIRGHDFLFAAVAASPELAAWQKLLREIANPVSDARLLPVESVKLLQLLSAKPAANGRNGGEKASPWRVLISHHRTGGFRQIVTRDHHLAIARMTPGFSDIGAPGDIVALLQREIGATIDYITRLGFDRAAGLDAVFIGRPDITAALAKAQLPVRHLTTFSPAEAEAIAGLSGTRDETGHFSDILHAAWGGSRILPALSVWPAPRRRERQKQLSQQWGSIVLAAAAALGMVYGADLMWGIQSAETQLAQAQAQNAQLQQSYDAYVSKLDSGPAPMARIRDVIALHALLDANEIDLNPLFAVINAVMTENVRLRTLALDIDRAPHELPAAAGQDGLTAPPPERKPVEGEIRLTLDLSSFLSAELAVAEAERLAAALQGAFPEMRTTITRQPLHILPVETLSVKPGENILAFTGDERLAEIEITGRLK